MSHRGFRYVVNGGRGRASEIKRPVDVLFVASRNVRLFLRGVTPLATPFPHRFSFYLFSPSLFLSYMNVPTLFAYTENREGNLPRRRAGQFRYDKEVDPAGRYPGSFQPVE